MTNPETESPRLVTVMPPADDSARTIVGPHSVWRERLIAGGAAATLVLCWYLLFDGLTIGNPWFTVQRIGGAVARFVIGGQAPTLVTALIFLCVLHYGAWIAIASFVLGVVHRGRKHPSIVVPAMLMGAILYVPLIGMIAAFVQLGWGSAAWPRFILGALIGSATVAAQAYRTHPDLVRYELAHVGDEEE